MSLRKASLKGRIYKSFFNVKWITSILRQLWNKEYETFLEVSLIMATAVQNAPGLATRQTTEAHAEPTKLAKHDVGYDMMYFALEKTPPPYYMG